jgi:hypothetical protein
VFDARQDLDNGCIASLRSTFDAAAECDEHMPLVRGHSIINPSIEGSVKMNGDGYRIPGIEISAEIGIVSIEATRFDIEPTCQSRTGAPRQETTLGDMPFELGATFKEIEPRVLGWLAESKKNLDAFLADPVGALAKLGVERETLKEIVRLRADRLAAVRDPLETWDAKVTFEVRPDEPSPKAKGE